MISVLLLGLVIIGLLSYNILQRFAREEVSRQASVLMQAALAMREYTIKEIKPLLAIQNKRNFLPQSVPSYAATQNFQALREIYPEYRYKEATLNPTNPRDRATDWEADLIQEFRQNADKNHITLVRDTPMGESLYYARPIRIKNQECLTCHGILEDAPKSMIELYGPANGFGWKMNEVVGSQIVSVPLSFPIKRANTTFKILISTTVAVFLSIYLTLIFFFKNLFFDRVITLTSVVEDVAPEKNVAYKTIVARVKDLLKKKGNKKNAVIQTTNSTKIKDISTENKNIYTEKEVVKTKAEDPVSDLDTYFELADYSTFLNQTDSDEELDAQSISLKNMYQKPLINASLSDDAFDIDDAITEITSDSFLSHKKN